MLYNLLMGFRETVLPACWFERRLRAIRDRVFLVGADLIAVVENGRITQLGPHDALVGADGPYARLWAAAQGTGGILSMEDESSTTRAGAER